MCNGFLLDPRRARPVKGSLQGVTLHGVDSERKFLAKRKTTDGRWNDLQRWTATVAHRNSTHNQRRRPFPPPRSRHPSNRRAQESLSRGLGVLPVSDKSPIAPGATRF